MITEKSVMKTEVLYSDDKQHRYFIKKAWDSNLPTAAIIMLSASNIANTVCLDMTSMYVINNSYKQGFGAVFILNLFSKMDTVSHESNSENDAIILKVAKECDSIIMAYGTGCQSKKAIDRINVVLELLKPYEKKLFEISDGNNSGFHPLGRTVRANWSLIPFSTKKLE